MTGISIKKQILIDSGLHLDAHLFFLAIPFVVILLSLVFSNKLKATNKRVKNIFAFLSGVAMISLFALSFYDMSLSLNKTSVVSVHVMRLFYNANDLMLFVMGLALLTRKFGILRMLTPSAIVIGVANLINNPGASLTYTEVSSNIILVCLPLIIVMMQGKYLTFKSLVLASIINVSVLTFIATINAVGSTSYSMLSSKTLSSNPVYSNVPSHALQVIMFICGVIIFEIITWSIMKLALRRTLKLSYVLHSIRNEIKGDVKSLVKLQSLIIDLNENDIQEIEVKDEPVTEEVADFTPVFEVEKTQFKFNYISRKFVKINGARSPSL